MRGGHTIYIYITSRYITYYILHAAYVRYHQSSHLDTGVTRHGHIHTHFIQDGPAADLPKKLSSGSALLCRRICIVGSAAVFWGTYNCCGGIVSWM